MKTLVQIVRDAGAQTFPAYRVWLTPKLAQTLLDRMGKNRPIRESVVERYIEEQAADAWPFTGQPIIVSTDDQMLDGQHRCLSVVRSGVSIDVLIVFGVPPSAYYRMDQGTIRNGADFLESTTNRHAVAAALALAWREEAVPTQDVFSNNTYFPRGDVPLVLARYPLFGTMPFNDVRALLPPSLGIYAKVRSRFAAGDEVVTWEAFWSGVAVGDGLSVGDARLTLRNHLITAPMKGAKLMPAARMGAVIRAWVAFRNGERLTRVQAGSTRWPGAPIAAFAEPGTPPLVVKAA